MDRIVKRNSKGCKIYLVKPGNGKNAHEFAERLASFANVEEVMLTEGDFGYIVKAAEDPNENAGLRKAMGRPKEYSCYCSYKG